MSRCFHILNPGFIARGITIIPVAVEQRTIRHTDCATVRLVKQQRLRTVHPEGVLHFQVIEVALRAAHAILFEQLHHERKDRRLGTAEIIGSVTVRDMAVALNQPRKIIRHTLQQIVPATLGQPQHREVGVPVIGLAESSARDDISLRQCQQGRPGDMVLRLARQHRPQAIDMLFKRQTGIGNVLFAVVLR